MRRFETLTLIRSPSARQGHVKASPIQNHSFYFDLYAGTMCGNWIQVAWIGDPLPISELHTAAEVICPLCVRRMKRFA